jgi:hypothetical protein
MCDELFIELTRMLGYESFIMNAKGKCHSYFLGELLQWIAM